MEWAWEKLWSSDILPLTQEQRAYLQKNYLPSIMEYQSGNIALLQGTAIDHLIIVIDGAFSAEMPDSSGKVLKVETLRAPALVASGLLFSSQNQLPVQLRAETYGSLLSFSKEECLQLLAEFPDYLESFLTDMGNKIAFLAEKLRMQQFSSLKQKIAGYFLKQAKLQGSPKIQLSYTLETLADLFGVSRPSLSRSLAEMGKEGYLEKTAAGQYWIDHPALKNLLV